MRLKKIFSITNVIVCLFLIAVIVICLVAISNSFTSFANEKYMSTDNLAKEVKVTGDIAGGKKIVDGKEGTYAQTTKKDCAIIVLDLLENKQFNSIILKEEGLVCSNFIIETSLDGEKYITIHKGDKIEYHRLCTFESRKARFIRVTVKGKNKNVCLKEIEVYNESIKSNNFRVSGYYSDGWDSVYYDGEHNESEADAVVDENIRKFNIAKLTNMFMYCGLQYNSEGDVFMSVEEAQNEVRKSALKKLIARIRNANPSIKISATFGVPTGNEAFLTAIDSKKDIFMKNLVDICNELGFDGVDIDYEFPVSKNDYALFDAFLIKFKKYMIENLSSNTILSCAFGTRDIKYSKDAREAIDIVNCMTYDIFDQDGEHSSFWGGCIQGGLYLESVGFEKSQINIGIPFYGTQKDALMEQYLYKDLEFTDYYENEYTLIDYIGEPTQVYFNSASMARDKTAYALLAGYGGIMTWHSSIDKPIEDKNSLWRAINDAVSQFGGVQ